MTQERQTSQKEIILEYLKSVKIHPSADKVYSEVRKKLPRISRGTVYRNLNSFTKKKEVQLIPTGGICRFDGDVSPHAHFICQNCNRVFDIFGDVCRNCQIIKKKKTKVGKIKSYKINFYGICKSCSKK